MLEFGWLVMPNCSVISGMTPSALAELQGDHSGCSLGVVDMEAKFLSYYKEHILKHNLGFDVEQT